MAASLTLRRAFIMGVGKTLAATQLTALLACSDAPAAVSGGTGADSEDGTGFEGTCCDPSVSTGGEASSGVPEPGDSSSGATSGVGGSSSSVGTSTTSDGDGGGASSTTNDGAQCAPSPSDIEGPFYRPNIPIGGNLDVHGDPGTVLTLRGKVLSTTCQSVAGAIVEIWHATPAGPDADPGDVDAIYDDSSEYRYYGQVATEADGSFAFTTKRPGWYLSGQSYRPAHVHLKIWVRGVERLTTQLYFAGDPFNDGDPWFNPLMALDPDDAGVAEIQIVV